MLDFFRRRRRFKTWINSDGSEGGQVSEQSFIDPKATVEKFGLVLSGTHLGPDAHVKAGDIVFGESVIRSGPVFPKDRFKRFTSSPRM